MVDYRFRPDADESLAVRAVVQRVRRAAVRVGGEICGEIERGLVVFLGVAREDGAEDVRYLADKIVGLRVFPDGDRSMNVDLREAGGAILLVSQFTLYGDCRRGRRPSFDRAGDPGPAEALYRSFAERLAELGFPPAEGRFRANMQVELENDGPVTLLLDSERKL